MKLIGGEKPYSLRRFCWNYCVTIGKGVWIVNAKKSKVCFCDDDFDFILSWNFR